MPTDANKLPIRVNSTSLTGLTTVAHGTWVDIRGILTGKYAQIVARSVTDSNTVTLDVWGSDDGGTTYYPLLRADTLSPAKSVAIAVGTIDPDRAGTGANVDSFAVALGPSTHIKISETSPGTDNFTYEVGDM